MRASRVAVTRQEAASPGESRLRAICSLTSSSVQPREPAAAPHDQTSCGFHLRSLCPQLQSRSGSWRWSRHSTAPGPPYANSRQARAVSRRSFFLRITSFSSSMISSPKESARCSELHPYDNVRRRCEGGARSQVTRASRHRVYCAAWARCTAGAAVRSACPARTPFPASARPSPRCARSRTTR